MTIYEILIVAGVPTAITGLLVWWIQRIITRRDAKYDKEQAKQEALRTKEQLLMHEMIDKQVKQAHKNAQVQERYNLLLLESMQAVEILAEATAHAVQRIPDAKCNGDMTAALEHAKQIDEERREFLRQQAVQNIYD